MPPARPHRFDRLLCRIWCPCRAGQMRARRKGEAQTHLKRPICCPPYLLQVGKSYRQLLNLSGCLKWADTIRSRSWLRDFLENGVHCGRGAPRRPPSCRTSISKRENHWQTGELRPLFINFISVVLWRSVVCGWAACTENARSQTALYGGKILCRKLLNLRQGPEWGGVESFCASEYC